MADSNNNKSTASMKLVNEEPTEEKAGLADMWALFRKEKYPHFVDRFRHFLGRHIGLQVDWVSLGTQPRLDESLSYDLEMLSKTMDSWHPYEDPRFKVDRKKLFEGINKIHMRRVQNMEKRRFEVIDDILWMDFCWDPEGRFAPNEIEALLLDRSREGFSKWVKPPETQLLPLMEEVRRNRLPVHFRNLEKAMSYPIPLEIDWPSLSSTPDAPHRLSYMFGELIKALKEVAMEDPGLMYGSERERKLARQLAEERSSIVKDKVTSLKLCGGFQSESPVIRSAQGVLELTVFQDDEIIQKSASERGKRTVITDIKRFPLCNKRALVTLLIKMFDLEIGPFLRQIKSVHLPITQDYIPEFFEKLIGKTPYKAPERVELRKTLRSKGISLEVDWDSITSLGNTEDILSNIRKFETGENNFNSKYGEVFKDLFFGIEEATREDRTFLIKFFKLVREIHYEQVKDIRNKELVIDGSSLVLRQCLIKPGGTISYDELTKKLLVLFSAETDERSKHSRDDFEIDTCLAGLREVVGKNVTLDNSLIKNSKLTRETCLRIVEPLKGAVAYLLAKPGYPSIFQEQLKEIHIQHKQLPGENPFSYNKGILILDCAPELGASGCPAGDEMAESIDNAIALRVRSDIVRIERENRNFWHRMLRERFGRDLEIEIDWEAFLSHPTQGGNRLYPLYVQQHGVERLIYALTGWMDDEEFREKVFFLINFLRVTSVANPESKELLLEDDKITYRCFHDMDLKGYFTIDELQQHLHSLLYE